MKIRIKRNIIRFFQNLLFFIISLIISLLIWFYVVSGSIEKSLIEVKIIPKVKKNLCILSYSPENITISAEAKKRQIILLSFSKAYIYINDDVGKYTITLDASNIKFPVYVGKVNFYVMGRKELTLEIDSVLEKKAKVLMIQGLGSKPDSVKLIGPKKLIGDVNTVIPDSIPEVGKTTTITLGEKLIKVIPNTIKVIH